MNKIIFAGTTEFGIPALEILKRDFDLALVITQPDKPVGRKKILTAPPVKVWAQSNGVKVIQPEKIIDAKHDIEAVGADVLVVAAYGQIIPKEILELPKHGSLNLHTSLLPKYRGASPIQNALMNDDKETGVTIIQMDEKMDHGPIVARLALQIDETDTYQSLEAKMSLSAASLLSQTLPRWIAGQISPMPQYDSEATYVKLINREDARIDWTKSARSIHQKVRALNPEPGTWTTLDKKSVKIIKTEEVQNNRVELPGKIYLENSDCLVKCGDYSLKLVIVQPEGKNPISGKDFANGLKQLETKVFI